MTQTLPSATIEAVREALGCSHCGNVYLSYGECPCAARWRTAQMKTTDNWRPEEMKTFGDWVGLIGYAMGLITCFGAVLEQNTPLAIAGLITSISLGLIRLGDRICRAIFESSLRSKDNG